MKVLILAGLFSVAAIPFAAASETVAECELDDARRAHQQRAEATAPEPNVARPTIVQRDESAQREEAPQRAAAVRRRSGKPIPDAELIGPRRAL